MPPISISVTTQRIIALGYALLLLLLVGTMVLVMARMLAIKARMENLVHLHNVQVEQVYEMRSLARERYARLTQMALLDDPFERDEEFLRYRDLGAQFIRARDRMLGLGLNDWEEVAWEAVRGVIHDDDALHDRALALMQDDRRAEAQAFMVSAIRPVEARLLAELNRLLELKREAGAQALVDTETEYRRTLWTMVGMTLIALVAGYVVARRVMQRSRKTESDLDEQRRLAEASASELAWAANHDALTGLVNRNEFEQRLALLLQDARHNNANHVLIYMDLDQFKIVNDTAGHVAGDELLRQLALLMPKRLRSGDTIARLGGDEFGLLLANCPIDKGRDIAEHLRDDLAEFRFT